MTSLTAAVDSASLWVWTGGWRTHPWRASVRAVSSTAGRAVLRVLLFALMAGPWLLAAGARLAARAWVRAVWAAGWALSWTVAAFAAGWDAAGGRPDVDEAPPWV